MPSSFAQRGECRQGNDKLSALEQALTLWTGPFSRSSRGRVGQGRDRPNHRNPRRERGRLVDELISAHRATDAIAAAEGQIGHYPYRDDHEAC